MADTASRVRAIFTRLIGDPATTAAG